MGTVAVLSQVQDGRNGFEGERITLLHGEKGAVSGLPSPKALEMLSLWTEDHREDGQQCSELEENKEMWMRSRACHAGNVEESARRHHLRGSEW